LTLAPQTVAVQIRKNVTIEEYMDTYMTERSQVHLYYYKKVKSVKSVKLVKSVKSSRRVKSQESRGQE
jgi:hypothetical protein